MLAPRGTSIIDTSTEIPSASSVRRIMSIQSHRSVNRKASLLYALMECRMRRSLRCDYLTYVPNGQVSDVIILFGYHYLRAV